MLRKRRLVVEDCLDGVRARKVPGKQIRLGYLEKGYAHFTY